MSILDSEEALTTKPDFFSSSVENERTFYRSEPVEVNGVAIVCGGREHCRADYRIDRKSLPYLGLEWVARGKGELIMNGVTHQLQAGALFLYGPGVPHVITTHPQERLVKYFVDFEGPGTEAALRQYKLRMPLFRMLRVDSGILEIFDRLIEAGTSPLPSGPQLCRLLWECLIVLSAEEDPDGTNQQGQAWQTYSRCRAWLEQNFRTVHRVEDAADACHLDPAYLTRVFQRFAKQSPHRFLTRLKMNAAALSLVRRGTNVKQVAEEFGYADPYHFSKAFKRIHGLSPSHYLASRAGSGRCR
ncbi:MAG: AraC family transcriptional regulator [Candidatus Methylacidiphilales bacterium]|nr:AraC family transcriptional regulator [Candidatus Methylacidiphilales bacterium]